MPAGSCVAARPLLAAALLIGLTGAASAAGWRTDLATARAEATRLDRPLLIHFYAEWCAPCKRMDREVLHAPDFLAAVDRQVVPVKLDVDQHRDVAQRYGVESVPTDLFLTPDGRVLGHMNGYRTKADYLRRVAAIESQYSRLRDLYLAKSDTRPPIRATTDDAGPRFPTLERPETVPLSDQEQERPPSLPRVKPREDGTILVGLKGHSPVALYHERRWVKGDPKYAWEHQGLTYLMASAEELAKFRDDAERYAPRLLGCDPVLYFDEGRAVPGSTAFAAYYANGLFLFTSAETRTKFRETPDQYTKRRTVLLIDELESILR